MAIDLATYQDVADLVYGLINDNETSQRLMTTSQFEIWCNSALSELSEHAEFVDIESTRTLEIGVGEYAVNGGDAEVLNVWRYEIEDEYIDPTTTGKLYKSSRTWQEQSGQPRWYYMDSLRVNTSASVGFGLWPKPNAAYVLRTISTQTPAFVDYANIADKVMLPLWCTQSLVWGVLALFYSSESRLQNTDASKFYRMLFDECMTRLRARSYARLNRSKAYGSGSTKTITGDIRNLLPADGFPYP